MKIVYNKSNGAEVVAYQDPMQPGRYALPANSVDVAPPLFDPENELCSWDGVSWDVTLKPEPEPEPEPYIETYVDKRRKEYGPFEDQLEYITEYGLEAWQQKVAEIKTKYPKDL